MKLKDAYSLIEKLWPTYIAYWKAEILLWQQNSVNQSYDFSSSHVWMSELDHKESWALKNWYFWTVVLEKTLESLLGCKEIKPVNPKGNQSWIFIGRTDAEVETPILWPPDAKNWLIEKDFDVGKDWGRRWREWWWMSWLDGITVSMHMSLSNLPDWWWQRILACFSPWGIKESDTAKCLS